MEAISLSIAMSRLYRDSRFWMYSVILYRDMCLLK